MNTKTILAILVVLLFVAGCTNNATNNGEKPKPLDNTQDTNKPAENTDTAKTDTLVDTKVTVPLEPEITEQELPKTSFPITLTAEKAGDDVKLTWTPFAGKMTSYKIVRSTTDPNPKYPGADLLETIINANDTTYTDTKAQVGINYYAVGVLTTTNKGEMSNVVSVEFKDSREKEGNKITLTAVKTAEGVNLTWSQYDEATGKLMYYKVVRSDTNPRPKYPNDNGITAITYVDKTSFLDRGTDLGKTYYYSITVVRKDLTRYSSEPVVIV